MKKRISHSQSLIPSPQSTVNKSLPYIMHIDLNSCFAIIEQQANRLLRGKPVGVAAYDTPRGFVLAASYEAKAKGVKMGVNVAQAKAMCPGMVIVTPDPPKYREAHRRFREVLLEYSPDVVAKSIDEFVVSMQSSPALRHKILDARRKGVTGSAPQISNLKSKISEQERKTHNQAMESIALDIKRRISERLGEAVTVNIGIGTNRFLAKYAAGFDKPNGMTLIDHQNLVEKYTNMKLVDLPGINVRYRARLRAAQIYTPLDFLAADMSTLRKQVFKSIQGYHWYRRLRGYEADSVDFSRKSIGHQHALSNKTTYIEELQRLLIKLCEKVGRRLRRNNYYATGIHLYLGFVSDMPNYDGPSSFENMHTIRSWHHGEKVHHRLYSTQDIYDAAKRLLLGADIENKVKIISVNVFGLEPWNPEQLSIFDAGESRVMSLNSGVVEKAPIKMLNIRSADAGKRVSDAVDKINDKYGEFVVTPAAMLDMQGTILDRIAFGQVRDL